MATHWRLRRLAPRALKVLERNKDKSAAIAAFEAVLRTHAGGYIEIYSQTAAYQAQWRREMDEGRGSMASLKQELDMWKPHVARERAGFDLSTIGDKPTVPEDLIEDAHALAEQLDEIKDAEGHTVGWAAGGAQSIRAKADIAEKETDEAAAADARYSQLLMQTRNAAAILNAELNRFRQTLRSVIGSSHPDYQKLRETKAATSDADDDAGSPRVAPPVTPAPQPPTG